MHFSCIVSKYSDGCPYRDIYVYYEDCLPAQEIQRYQKVIRYHPFGIGMGTDIVLDISVPEIPPVVPKYRNTEIHSVFPALVVGTGQYGQSSGLSERIASSCMKMSGPGSNGWSGFYRQKLQYFTSS